VDDDVLARRPARLGPLLPLCSPVTVVVVVELAAGFPRAEKVEGGGNFGARFALLYATFLAAFPTELE